MQQILELKTGRYDGFQLLQCYYYEVTSTQRGLTYLRYIFYAPARRHYA